MTPQELFLLLIETTMQVRTELTLTNVLLACLLGVEALRGVFAVWVWYHRPKPQPIPALSNYRLPERRW